MALVELALHRLPPDLGGHLIVQPRVVCRTVEIERAIVQLIDGQMQIAAAPRPTTSVGPSPRRVRLTEEVFFEELDTDTATKQILKSFLRDVVDLGLVIDVGGHLHIKNPELRYNFGTFKRDGDFRN